MLTSIENIEDFLKVGNEIMKNHPKNEKVCRAISKVANSCRKSIEEYKDQVDDINIDHANTDKNGSLLREQDGSFSFTAEKMKEAKIKIKQLRKEESFEVTPCMVSDLPDGIPDFAQEYLVGFIIEKVIEKPIEQDK